ncbi:hypothetical protein RVV18_006642, partial [Burkholderia ambifaria]|nr:hypothetical protein [Burkholderia ambifaria]
MSLRVSAARHSTKVPAQPTIRFGRGGVRADPDPGPVDGFQLHALSPSMCGGANRQRVHAARPGRRGRYVSDLFASMGGRRDDGKLNIRLGASWKMNGAGRVSARRRPARGLRAPRFHSIDISGGVMQRYSIRYVSRAVFAGILIAGLAAGAGCQKKSET